jgi:uncharacterized protein (DUF2147 family)
MKNDLKRSLFVLGALAFACVLATLPMASPATASDTKPKPKLKRPTLAEHGIFGEWWSEQKDGRIRFYKHRDGTVRGNLAWSKHPRPDVENDNPKLRSRSIIGIVLMWQLRYEDGEYEDGYVYNPEDGNVYRVDIKVLSPDKLKVRGYMGISLFGQSQVWTRYR